MLLIETGDPPLQICNAAGSVLQLLIGWADIVAAVFGLEPIGWVDAIDWLAMELHNGCCEVIGKTSTKWMLTNVFIYLD